MDTNGKSTKAGDCWAAHSESALPAGGYLQQKATRVGNVEYITTQGGKRQVTRRWDPGSEEYKFTKVGKQYYAAQPRRNYVVMAPITAQGKRKTGLPTRSSHTFQSKSSARPLGRCLWT